MTSLIKSSMHFPFTLVFQERKVLKQSDIYVMDVKITSKICRWFASTGKDPFRPIYLRMGNVESPLYKQKMGMHHPLAAVLSVFPLSWQGLFWAPLPSHAHPSPYDEYKYSCGN